MNRPDKGDLIAKALRDSLSEAEKNQWEQLLEDDPELRNTFAEEQALDRLSHRQTREGLPFLQADCYGLVLAQVPVPSNQLITHLPFWQYFPNDVDSSIPENLEKSNYSDVILAIFAKVFTPLRESSCSWKQH